MINFQLAREIYGVVPWHVDQFTLPALINTLEHARAGLVYEKTETKYNSLSILDIRNAHRLISDIKELNSQDDFEGIGIIHLNGPITKYGGASSYGMLHLSSMMLTMAKDDRIISFIILADSGGGSSGAVQIMADAIDEVKVTKPVYALVTKGGIAASACYGVLASCNKIYSESKMNLIGSLGTMVKFEGREANSQDPDGLKYIRLYASKSTQKNADVEMALNNDNYKSIIEDLLDPVNEVFLDRITQNRPQVNSPDILEGGIKFARDCVGTLIDGLKSFDEVLEIAKKGAGQVNSVASTNTNPSNQFNLKTTTMNINQMSVEQLKQAFPEAYQEGFNQGIQAERKRTAEWLEHIDNYPTEVLEGIRTGKAFKELNLAELNDFYSSIDKKLNLHNHHNEINFNRDNAQLQSQEGIGEAEVKNENLNDFYSEVDRMLQQDKTNNTEQL